MALIQEAFDIRFSVIIPLYNKERSIASTLMSVLDQTYTKFELIIVNDGSTDNSLEEVLKFDDPRIKMINKPNQGVSSARNRGVMEAKNDFVVFLDADDLWLPFCLEEFLQLITFFPETSVFCTNFNMSGRDLKGTNRRYYLDDYYYATAFYLAKWSVRLMVTGCVAIRRDLFAKAGVFNPSLTHGEDIDMWERLSSFSGIAKSERITTLYRTDAENRASLADESQKLQGNPLLRIKNQKLSKSRRLYYGVQFAFDVRSLILSRHFSIIFKKYSRYTFMIIRAMFFIVFVRIINPGYSPFK